MAQEWRELSALVGSRAFVVERVRLVETGVALEGDFELPELARLPPEDQVFVAAFIRGHGSIKAMEQVFGVSYPTIKARLNRIAGMLEFVDEAPPVITTRGEVLARLARGEIDADAAAQEIEALK